jgi:hypothetical protein
MLHGLDLIPKGGQLWNKPPRFENLKKQSLENNAKNIFEKKFTLAVSMLKRPVPYRKTAFLQ